MFQPKYVLKSLAVGLLALMLAAATTPSTAKDKGGTGSSGNGAALPALPSATVINQVISGSSGPVYTPLGVPASILNGFSSFQAAGMNIASSIDVQQSVSYITTGAALAQIAMPLLGASTTTLQANMNTPDDSSYGRIIGGLYQSTNGNSVVVVIFDGGNKIKELRFYYYSGLKLTYNSLKYKGRKLQGVSGQPSPTDQGAVIANSEVCFTIGLDQVCFPPDAGLRDSSVSATMQQSYQTLSTAYNLQVPFDVNNPVPDLIGHNYRTQCASANLTGSSCTPNIIQTAALQSDGVSQPIAIFHVQGKNDLATYDVNGTLLSGGLPVGDYVVLNATPNGGSVTPGSVGVLFLVNALSGQPNYLILGRAVEGFGTSGDGKGNGKGPKGEDGSQMQAAIKDGMAGGWGW